MTIVGGLGTLTGLIIGAALLRDVGDHARREPLRAHAAVLDAQAAMPMGGRCLLIDRTRSLMGEQLKKEGR
ncbi:MAG: hypothetical protein OXI15_06095 [Chromatiales bacterium]|nr:hypothetical protein [Chromatiales bacterium]